MTLAHGGAANETGLIDALESALPVRSKGHLDLRVALAPIVITGTELDPLELSGVYRRRWPAREDTIRDWPLPLGLDASLGYGKTPAPNSEAE